MSIIAVKNCVLAGDRPVKTIVLGKKESKTIVLWPFQNEILIDHLSKHRFTITESPTGSGKSSIMLSYAVLASRLGKKVIIVTPQCGINFNFRKYVINSRFCAKGAGCDYTIPKGGIVREPERNKTDALKRFIKNPSERIYVATYQAFKLALNTGVDVSNVVLLVDEVHHSNIHCEQSYLGSILKQCSETCHEVHCFTATDFRTDGGRPTPKGFHKYRRTLAQHYSEGFCPDFGIFARFYCSQNRDEFEKMASGKNIGNPKALLESYVDEYLKSPLPTMMYVDNAKQANWLQRMLLDKSPQIRILNLGSDDGKILISDKPHLRRGKFIQLADIPTGFDVVISIRLCNEGIDWAECCQTFSPRITSSLQLFIQRCVGRTLRRKRENHPSPLYSRVVIFEISLNDHDRDEVTKAFLPMAIVLKAICEGLDFSDSFMLKLPGKHQHRFESERIRLRTESNAGMNCEILQTVLYESASGALPGYLINLCHDLYLKNGIELSGPTIVSMLIQTKVIDKSDVIDLEDAIRQRDKNLDVKSFSAFVSEYAVEIAQLRVIGVSDFIGILSGRNDLDKIAALLADYTRRSAIRSKSQLLDMARRGDPRPKPQSKNSEERRLGIALNNFINVGPYQDLDFAAAIKDIAPNWVKDPVVVKKKKLLALAKRGGKRPSTESENPKERALAHALGLYRNPNYTGYDPEFEQKIARLAPNWAKRPPLRSPSFYKKTLIALAKSGAPRPSCSSSNIVERQLYHRLIKYTSRKSKDYDEKFDNCVRQIAWRWFRGNIKNKYKTEILQRIKDSLGRPKWDSTDPHEKKLMYALYRYTNPKCPQYDQELVEKTASWFGNKTAGINYKPGHYSGDNDYRDFLLKSLQYYGFVEFSSDCEFWTLGGVEWYEYKFLVRSGIEFGPRSYHNVDRGCIANVIKRWQSRLSSRPTCCHKHTEFFDIRKIWRKPSVLAFDSTMALSQSNTVSWQELCHLGIDATKISGSILLTWNLVAGYANKLYKSTETDLYDNWIEILDDLAEYEGVVVDFFKEGQITKRKKSSTPMLAGCCKLTLTQAMQKAS